MVVLEPDSGPVVPRLLQHRVREATIDRVVALPVAVARARQRGPQVAERPEKLVRVPVVVVVEVLLVQPEPAQGIARLLRRHAYAALLVDDLGIRLPAAPRDPGPANRLEQRIQRGDQPPGRPPHHDLVRPVLEDVLVGFTVAYDDEALIRKRAAQRRSEEHTSELQSREK